MIDLRSDTVTKPTPAMRRAMFEAEVGDDVYGEDPTVNRLEQRSAEILGKEAALFVPTGTMANTIAVKLHTRHGEEVICDSRSHVLNYELAMMAWFAGCVARPIATADGILTWERIEPEIRPLGPHWAPTGLIEIENTHNMAGGTIYPPALVTEIGEKTHALGLKLHCDGARIFNAAAALGVPVADLAAPCDTVAFCLSKGLGAPAGSILAGTRADIDRGRLYRKRLGGGMRQAGILAAAGLLALEEHPAKLSTDHEHARRIASALGIEGVQTNIVFWPVGDAPAVSARLKSQGILANAVGPKSIRFVTHSDVSSDDIDRAIAAAQSIRTTKASA